MGKEPLMIEILGTTLKVNTDEDPRYLSQIIEYLHEKTQEVKNSTKIDDPLKISILTSLFLIDELYKERSGIAQNGENQALSEITEKMIKKLEESLDT
ncbi:cell division protein ZapA [Marispirochaeta sp.]|jgi:cell division protein ZapA (FtsZ GTPase activity inhibitor)|uniref:cell division protein ZapA n=1 Tax=Marispirochaeta sp. TaxID=2038653 RepID=UPI0029C7DA3C|nr:cell division protein ZapA [Marispirochaeta sp.]